MGRDVVPVISQLEVVAVSVDTMVSVAKVKQYYFNCISLANKNELNQDTHIYAQPNFIKIIQFQEVEKTRATYTFIFRFSLYFNYKFDILILLSFKKKK